MFYAMQKLIIVRLTLGKDDKSQQLITCGLNFKCQPAFSKGGGGVNQGTFERYYLSVISQLFSQFKAYNN